MSDSHHSPPNTYPITGVCIVANAEKCPPGFELVYRSKDKNDDCDLWRKDGIFRTRVTRYLCFTRVFPLDGGRLNNVLSDISFINEKELPPSGYTIIDKTQDSGEPATKKKIVCVKMIPRVSTTDAITDLIILSRSRKAPPEYTFVGEVNGLNLCSKMGPVPGETQQPIQPNTNAAVPDPAPVQYVTVTNHVNPQQLVKQISTISVSNVMQDIPFTINTRLLSSSNQFDDVPVFHFKSQADIEKENSYDFQLEKSLVGR